MSELKELEEKFAEVEKRVRALVAENRTLTVRVRELEQELSQVRNKEQGFERLHGKQTLIREKIERVLRALETAKMKE